MTEAEKILKQALSNNPTTSDDVGSMNAFRNSSMSDVTWYPDNALFKTVDKGANTLSKNILTSTALMLGAGLILKNGRFMRSAAGSMRNYIKDFYAKGSSEISKAYLTVKEGVIGASKATRKLQDVNIKLGQQATDLEPGIKQSLDEIIGAKNLILKNPSNWEKGIMGHGAKLTQSAKESIKHLDKKLLGETNTAYALLTKKHGHEYAKQSPLYDVGKHMFTPKTYSYKKGEGFKQLADDMKIRDKEVLTTGLSAWNMNLKQAIKKKSLNVLNIKQNQLQNTVSDTIMSREGTLSFLAYEKGLMNPGTKIKDLQKFFLDNGYRATKNKTIFKIGKGNSEKSIIIRKTKQGTTHIQYSPARKGQYYLGGFSGNLVFNNKLHKGKVGVFGTDVFDIKGDKLVGLRKTPLLNVSNVKEIKVPVIKSKKPPPIPNDKVKTNSYNKKIKVAEESLEEVKSKVKYGIKETKEYSQDVEEYFGLLNKSPKNRPHLRQYTASSSDYNNALKSYYKLYTKVTMGKATPQQRKEFNMAKAMLGIEITKPAAITATALGAYSMLRKDED